MAVIHCLGTGLVGSYVAKKLAENGHQVYAHDINPDITLVDYPNITIEEGDALEKCSDIINLGKFDIIVNMLPGDIGHTVIKKLCKYDVKVVDLSFSEITPDIVIAECENMNATILWDVGIAPGLSNMLLAMAYREFGKLKNGEIRVGGNPVEKRGVWNYMAPFSPKDVIAEYTRPARVVRDSKITIIEALSDRHSIEVSGKGTMEAFLTDGLRSILYSIPALDLSEYTVRWPGHIQKFIDERDNNTLNYDKLLKEWKYDSEIKEFTWMEVKATAYNGEKVKWIISDDGDKDGHSMARCTGLVTVFCVEEWLKDPDMLTKGVHPPENLHSEVIERIIGKMKKENINIEFERNN
jgi:lysine 6-dehydrogenase